MIVKNETAQASINRGLGYFSAINRNKLLLHTTWINFKHISLSKKKPYSKEYRLNDYLYEVLAQTKIIYGGKKIRSF